MRSFLLKMPQQMERIIELDCPELIWKLEMKYGRYVSACESMRMADIRITKSGEAVYTLTIGDTVTQTAQPLVSVERFLFEHPSYDAGVLALHGAAVEWQGKCYVFLASTTTGKTTLTSYLAHCGFGYITEDCVLLDRSTHKVHPFPMPLHLREGGVKVLRRYDAVPVGLQCLRESEDGPCRYVYTPQCCVEKPLPLGEMFFIERTDSQNAVLSMTLTEKIAALMKSPITVYPVTAEYLHFLADLSTQYGKRLQYCDMNFVKEVIGQYAIQSST